MTVFITRQPLFPKVSREVTTGGLVYEPEQHLWDFLWKGPCVVCA